MAPPLTRASARAAGNAASAEVVTAEKPRPKETQCYSRRPKFGPNLPSKEDLARLQKEFHSQCDALQWLTRRHINNGGKFPFEDEMRRFPLRPDQPVPRYESPTQAEPSNPSNPTNPTNSDQPRATPSNPSNPEQPPTNPEQPRATPTNPPADPSNPSNLTNPSNPEQPRPTPTNPPADPSNPSNLTNPSNPEQDQQPRAIPTNPTNPTNPSNSEQPQQPKEPATARRARRTKRKRKDVLKEKSATTAPSLRRVVTRSRAAQEPTSGQPEIEPLQPQDEAPQDEANDEPTITEVEDDGTKRCHLHNTVRALHCIGEALSAAGAELDVETVASVVETRKTRKKNKDQPRQGRGLGKPRDPAPPSKRPQVKPVADFLFVPSAGTCTQLKTTIRLLTLQNMPGPYRTYNMFPVQSRLSILKQFLQRYTWSSEYDVRRCLYVYENVAGDLYGQDLGQQRTNLRLRYGEDKEEWKKHPARWCRNVEHWKGLCDIWATEKWEKMSETARDNMTKGGPVIHHVGGSRSMYEHMQSLMASQCSNEGDESSNVGLKELFDATHMIKTKSGMKKYVNAKARKNAEAFQELCHKAGPEIADEEIWEAVVGGEERGRLFGLGKRSRINVKRAVQVVLEEEEEACPTKNSTATTATSHAVFTREELDKIVSEKLAAQEAAYNEKIGQLQQVNDYNKICIDRLLQAAGLNPPHLDSGGPSGDAA